MATKGSKPTAKTKSVAPARTNKQQGSSKPATNKKDKKAPAKKTVRKPKAPKITDAQFEAWFFKQSPERFIELTEDWNDLRLKIKLKKQTTYDGWLNYFKTLSASQLRLLATTGLDILPTEGYAALRRWTDIISNPGRIDKIHRAGLTTGNKEMTIMDYAKKNNRLGVLRAMRDELASKLQQGAGARDAGTLVAQMTDIMAQIEIQERKEAPTPKTPLGALLSDIPEIKRKRPSKNGGGARHTSYASRVTIEDVEAQDAKK